MVAGVVSVLDGVIRRMSGRAGELIVGPRMGGLRVLAAALDRWRPGRAMGRWRDEQRAQGAAQQFADEADERLLRDIGAPEWWCERARASRDARRLALEQLRRDAGRRDHASSLCQLPPEQEIR
ncbi:MAG TPA: hypothetical protein PKA20_14345 [Burkholderiaceae bacterium]|nr:hypothetical protein [Burkholderiaceae bacterium]